MCSQICPQAKSKLSYVFQTVEHRWTIPPSASASDTKLRSISSMPLIARLNAPVPHRIQTGSGEKMGLCRFKRHKPILSIGVELEGDVCTKLDAPCTGRQTARRPEGRTLNSRISKQPCRVIRQIEGLCLQVHVNPLKDRHILRDRHVEGVPLRTIDVIQIAYDSRSGVGNDDVWICGNRTLKARRKEVDVGVARPGWPDVHLRLDCLRGPADECYTAVRSAVDG